jgi:Flp pilus assembly protein TadB
VPQSLLILVILLLGFLSVFMLFLAIAKPKQKEDVESRLKRLNVEEDVSFKLPTLDPSEAIQGPPKAYSAIDNLNAQLDEVFKPLVKDRISDSDTRSLKLILENAGRYGMSPLQLRLWQCKAATMLPIAIGILSFGVMGFNMAITPLLLIGAAVGGFYYPILALHREAAQRRTAILRQLPTTLDLLTICVEAGLSLQAALFKVVEKTRPSPLRDEIDQVLREIQLGRPRAESLKNMAKRINLKEVNSVVLSMVQAEAMGTSIAKSLRIQSEIAREGRWMRAQEQAFQAPVKLSFPLVFFIFPVIFIVIFGPVGLELYTNWQKPPGTETPAASPSP